MGKPTLYLMLGYPGSGKTTTAQAIHELSGATHLWADQIRRDRYISPTYSHAENIELYDHLNQLTEELLAAGNSVVYDTNFSFLKDREKLRQIAASQQANSVLVWIQTTQKLAKERATKHAKKQKTRVLGDMSSEHFDRIASNQEPPAKDEPFTAIDGTKVTPEYVAKTLGL